MFFGHVEICTNKIPNLQEQSTGPGADTQLKRRGFHALQFSARASQPEAIGRGTKYNIEL